MAWNKPQLGKATLISTVGAGALLLSGQRGKRHLFIVTAEGTGDDRSVIYFSEDGKSGMAYVSQITGWCWDVTDIAAFNIDLSTFVFDDAEAAGMFGTKDGPSFLSFDVGGSSRANIQWLSLESFKLIRLARSVRFTDWTLVVEDNVVFKWPLTVATNAAGST